MRLSLLAPFALLFASCQSPAPLLPIAVRDPFAVAYRGDVAPAVPVVEPTEPVASTPTNPGAPCTIHATILELTAEDGRQVLSNLISLPEFGAAEAGGRIPDSVRLPTSGIAGAHVERAAMTTLLENLKGRAEVVMAPELAASHGIDTTASMRNKTAYVRSVTLRPMALALIGDPMVDAFETGETIRFRIEERKGANHLVVTWESSEPMRPLPLASTRAATVQVPVVLTHQLSCDTPVENSDSVVVASLPGSDAGRVQILLVAIDHEGRDWMGLGAGFGR